MPQFERTVLVTNLDKDGLPQSLHLLDEDFSKSFTGFQQILGPLNERHDGICDGGNKCLSIGKLGL